MRSKSRSEPRGKQERQHCPRNVHYFSRQIHLRRMLLKPIGEYINRLVHICCRQFFSATLQTKRTGLVKSPLENGSEGPLMLPTTCKRLGLMTVASNRIVLFWELHNFILAVLQKKKPVRRPHGRMHSVWICFFLCNQFTINKGAQKDTVLDKNLTVLDIEPNQWHSGKAVQNVIKQFITSKIHRNTIFISQMCKMYPGCQRFPVSGVGHVTIVTRVKNLWSRARFLWEHRANDKPV